MVNVVSSSIYVFGRDYVSGVSGNVGEQDADCDGRNGFRE